MLVESRKYETNGLFYTIRPAEPADAQALSELRLLIDGETEHMDRERGEAYLDEAAFARLIREDAALSRNLFLVAEAGGKLAGFSRCQGSTLKRFSHRVEFGVCVCRACWGYGIGKALLQQSVSWADETGVRKMMLSVLETNVNAIALYERFGFAVEGVLQKDRLLSDGTYYATIVMGRIPAQIFQGK